MQIDVLSSNTLKLTLSRLDMFDLDIKYESLSGKNPETKRLLTQVLKSIKLDKKAGFDFSGERLFVEAFPRPDGGCMLYISCLENETSEKKKKNALLKSADYTDFFKIMQTHIGINDEKNDNPAKKSITRIERTKAALIFQTDNPNALGGVCKSLVWQTDNERLKLESSLYENKGKYRLIVKGDAPGLINSIIREYGELLRGDKEINHTKEYYKPLIQDQAVKKISELF